MMAATKAGIDFLIWTVVFTFLDVLFVSVRFWAAWRIKRPIYADDYFIAFSLASTFATEGVLLWASFHGMGRRATEMTQDELVVNQKSIPAAYVTWIMGTTAFKLSLLCLYDRVFSPKNFRRGLYVVMGLSVAYCISFLVVLFTNCQPNISQLWKERPDGHCRDLRIGSLGAVCTSLALDIVIIILPLPFLCNLKLRLQNKIPVCFAFSLGIITIGTMVWRIHDLAISPRLPNPELVRDMPTFAVATMLELWLCIIIACVPTLNPIVTLYISPLVNKLMGNRPRPSNQRPSSGGPNVITVKKRFGVHGPSITTTLFSTMDDVEAQPMNPKDVRLDGLTTAHATSSLSVNTAEAPIAPTRTVVRVQQGLDISNYQAPWEERYTSRRSNYLRV